MYAPATDDTTVTDLIFDHILNEVELTWQPS